MNCIPPKIHLCTCPPGPVRVTLSGNTAVADLLRFTKVILDRVGPDSIWLVSS